MNIFKGTLSGLAIASLVLCGCETIPERVNAKGMVDQGHTTAGLDYRDFEEAANDAIKSIIASGNLNHPGGGRYVLMVSRIKMDSTLNYDPDQLTKKIRIALMNKGKVVVSTSVGINGPEDQATALVQSEFGGNGVVKPELSLSGKIIGKRLHYDSSKSQMEYYLQLTLTNLQGGYSVWEGETPIVKRADSKTPIWD